MFDDSPAYAALLDAEDELAPYREQFVIADPELIYLDGNSLGRLPRATVARLQNLVEEGWGERLIRGWNEGWYTLSRRIGARIAGILGAQPDEVIVADSTSVNLYKLAFAALAARPGRRQILSDDLNFPSDLYVLQGVAAQHGGSLVVVPSPDGLMGPVEGLARALNGQVALLSLSHTAFKSGYTYDMAGVTALAHDAGALVLWDLSHSAGAVPVDLGGSGADLAVGCTYKYLNGGPGAPAFLFVRRELQERLANPIQGWFGQKNAFELALAYEPEGGMGRFLSGTPPILSLAAIEPGIEMLLDAGMDRLRAKSVRQTDYLMQLVQAWLAPLGFRLGSPRDPAFRGSHVALGHEDAAAIDLALIEEEKVLPDFRRPDSIRFGLAALYTRFAEIHEAMARLRRVVEEGSYRRYRQRMPAVT